MLNRKVLVALVLILVIVANVLMLFVFTAKQEKAGGKTQVGMRIIAPFQEVSITAWRAMRSLWRHYFWTLHVAEENDDLKRQLQNLTQERSLYREIQVENQRLRRLLDMREAISYRSVVCQVVGKDPSPWFKTLIVDKGKQHGLQKGLAALAPEGIVGQVIDVTEGFAKVLLVIDGNCAVDALGQITRVRGILKGGPNENCLFQYVSRKDEVRPGETIVSSGLDGVFRKGWPIGEIQSVYKQHSGIFQEITVRPFVDFPKLEEVIIVLDKPEIDWLKP